MITKEDFIRIMDHLEDLDKKMEAVDKAMQALDSEFCSFYIADIFNITIEVLENMFNDKGKWIDYFIWERNWLRDFKLGDIIIDDSPLKIENWGDVYDFLVSNMMVEINYLEDKRPVMIYDMDKVDLDTLIKTWEIFKVAYPNIFVLPKSISVEWWNKEQLEKRIKEFQNIVKEW